MSSYRGAAARSLTLMLIPSWKDSFHVPGYCLNHQTNLPAPVNLNLLLMKEETFAPGDRRRIFGLFHPAMVFFPQSLAPWEGTPGRETLNMKFFLELVTPLLQTAAALLTCMFSLLFYIVKNITVIYKSFLGPASLQNGFFDNLNTHLMSPSRRILWDFGWKL